MICQVFFDIYQVNSRPGEKILKASQRATAKNYQFVVEE